MPSSETEMLTRSQESCTKIGVEDDYTQSVLAPFTIISRSTTTYDERNLLTPLLMV